MDRDTNSIRDLRVYFSTPEKPVSRSEILTFWLALTEEEQVHYLRVDLSDRDL